MDAITLWEQLTRVGALVSVTPRLDPATPDGVLYHGELRIKDEMGYRVLTGPSLAAVLQRAARQPDVRARLTAE